MRKVCVIITARPSYSRVKTLLTAINESKNLKLQIVLTSSALLNKYGNIKATIVNDGFEVDHEILNVIDSDEPVGAAKTTGLAIIECATALQRLNPDVVVTIADRFETIANAISAAYMNIPLAHIQGGEITGNIDEKVRHSITKLADLHFVATSKARENIIRMGENPNTVFQTGCPSIDLVKSTEGIQFSQNDIDKLGVGGNVSIDKEFLMVLQHPLTTDYRDSTEHTKITIEVILALNIPTFWFWPNVDSGGDRISKQLRTFREKNGGLNVKFLRNLDPPKFHFLLRRCKCLIGNSSVGVRECGYLGTPVVNVGNRQNKRERSANVIDCDHNFESIKKAVETQLSHGRYNKDFLYGDGGSGAAIVKILKSTQLTYKKILNY